MLTSEKLTKLINFEEGIDLCLYVKKLEKEIKMNLLTIKNNHATSRRRGFSCPHKIRESPLTKIAQCLDQSFKKLPNF